LERLQQKRSHERALLGLLLQPGALLLLRRAVLARAAALQVHQDAGEHFRFESYVKHTIVCDRNSGKLLQEFLMTFFILSRRTQIFLCG